MCVKFSIDKGTFRARLFRPKYRVYQQNEQHTLS